MVVMETGSLIQPCPQQEGLRYAFKDEHEGAEIRKNTTEKFFQDKEETLVFSLRQLQNATFFELLSSLLF
jgi:hypothetical protein